MQQWVAEIAYDTTSGTVKKVESFYMPSENDVRAAVSKKGGYVLSIRAHTRSPLERLLARSKWWQIQLLRGILFRSIAVSPGVALWKLIEAETNPMRQNILFPAREALSRGLGVVDALAALNIFDRGTISILRASEKINKLEDGIPHAIKSITQKSKNARAVIGTMSWLAIDVVSIVQALVVGRGMALEWFENNAPENPDDLEKFEIVVGRLELTWNTLIFIAFSMGAFMAWTIFSFYMNRGKADWPTARLVRKIPLIGGYLRDLGFADSMRACAGMIKGSVPMDDALEQAAESTTSPEVAKYWRDTNEALKRGLSLGAALDREPLTRAERIELAGLSDLDQVATILESISEMRASLARTKHLAIVWLAFVLTALFLVVAVGSAIYGLTAMNMSMDSMMGELTGAI